MRHETLLLEIGTEELPPKSLLALKTAFAENLKKALDARQFNYGDVAAFATPRRLAVIVTACEDVQPAPGLCGGTGLRSPAHCPCIWPQGSLCGFRGLYLEIPKKSLRMSSSTYYLQTNIARANVPVRKNKYYLLEKLLVIYIYFCLSAPRGP